MKKSFFLILFVIGIQPTMAAADCAGCPKGNCVRCDPRASGCDDYCADALRPSETDLKAPYDLSSPRSDLKITIPDATPQTAAKIRELLTGKKSQQ